MSTITSLPTRFSSRYLLIALAALVFAVTAYVISSFVMHPVAADDSQQRFGFVLVDASFTNSDLVAADDSNAVPVEEEISPLAFDEAQSRVSFVIPQPSWLPEGVSLSAVRAGTTPSADSNSTSSTVILSFVYADKQQTRPIGFLQIYQGSITGGYSVPRDAVEEVQVNNEPAVFVQGTWNRQGEWNSEAHTSMLSWADAEFTYVLSISGLEMEISELIQVASSVK